MGNFSCFHPLPQYVDPRNAESLYDFTVVDINRINVNLSMYEGKVLLLINTGRESKYMY